MVRASLALVCLLSAVSLAQEQPASPEQPPAPSPQTPAEAAATAPVPSSESAADWSMRSGKTMGEGQSAVAGEAGWPGIQTEYLFGLRPFLDLGGRFEFDWSFLGDTKNTAPGIKFQGILRVHMFDAGKLVFSARFEPGFLAFFFSSNGVQQSQSPGRGSPPALRQRSPAQVTEPIPSYSSASYYGTLTGITLPVSLEAGMPVSPGLLLNAKVAVPLTFTFGDVNGGTVIPLIFGVGAEYRLNPRLSIIVDLGAGPLFYVNSGTEFALNTMAGVAYKL
ncbi:MAG TPA: hypothetical protein VLT82_18560 [Myxococcaceae bacterium]|nr:hypothetical protein [Myxococcaceae bacterium]